MTDIPLNDRAPAGAVLTEAGEAVPPQPMAGEISTSGEGRDITLPFISALRDVQDTVLRRLGSSNFEVYRELRRDGQVQSTFQQRRLALKSRPLVVEPGGTDAASIAAAEQLKLNLAQISFDRSTGLMMWGAFYGYSVGECLWSVKDGKAWLDRVKVRTPWRFRYDWEGRLRLLTRTSMMAGEVMPPAKFWTTSWGADNDDDPYGLGLAHQLYWPVFFKKQGLGFWLRALEKFGAPSVVGHYPAGSDQSTINKLLAALQRMRMDGSLAIPEGTTATLLEAARGTVDQVAFNGAMNAEISKIVLGQTMTTDDGASLSQSQVHMGVREELTDADADEICESFMAGPAAWLTAWNFPGAKTPLVRRPAPEDEERAAKLLTAKAAAVKAMRDAGYAPTPKTEAQLFGDGWVPVPAAAPLAPAETPALPSPAMPPVLRLVSQGPAFAEGDPARDAIDDYVEAKDWVSIMEEPVAFLEAFLNGCADLEEARDRLPGLMATLPNEALRLAVAHSGFEAAVAGRAGLALSDQEDAEVTDGHA